MTVRKTAASITITALVIVLSLMIGGAAVQAQDPRRLHPAGGIHPA